MTYKNKKRTKNDRKKKRCRIIRNRTRNITRTRKKKTKRGGGTPFFIPEICSPKKKEHQLGYTCLDPETLVEITGKLTKQEDKYQETDHDLEDVYETMKTKLQEDYNCSSEACLMKKEKKLMNSKEQDKTFRPELPDNIKKDEKAWLSNFDINRVMEQFENAYSDFEYLDATPIDFHKCSVNNELCKLTLAELKRKKKNKLGIIFNTDTSDGEGLHWIALFVDMNGSNLDGKPGMYFVDSFAKEMPQEIKDLTERFQEESEEVLGESLVLSHNEKSFQENEYACGYYCMHFIEQMLKGVSFSDYKEEKPTDQTMKRYSKLCFVHPDIIESS